jgi:hypothetical protein
MAVVLEKLTVPKILIGQYHPSNGLEGVQSFNPPYRFPEQIDIRHQQIPLTLQHRRGKEKRPARNNIPSTIRHHIPPKTIRRAYGKAGSERNDRESTRGSRTFHS